MNLSGRKNRYGAHIEGIRSAFAGAVRVVSVDGDDNVLLFAFRHPRMVELPEFLGRRAVALERRFGLAFSRYLEKLRAGHVLGAGRELPT